MSISKFLTVVSVSFLTAGAAAAATVSLTPQAGAPASEAVPGIAGNDFESQLTATGVDRVYFGGLDLVTSGRSTVTFSLVAAESGFTNLLNFGSDTITEANGSLGDFSTGALGGQTFGGIIDGGINLAELITFVANATSGHAFTVDNTMEQFAVFANSAETGALSSFFLGLDDNGAHNDDDYDDILVRVDVAPAPVPLPAAAWMLLAALGGLFGLRRRRAAA